MAIPTDIDGTWGDSANPLDGGELRRADATMFAGVGSAFGVGGGITRHGDNSLSVSVDGSDVVTVQPGTWVAPGNAVSGSGCWRYGLSAAITGSLAARNATNPRITLVVARALDTSVVGSHAAYKGRIEFIDGTPAASPTVPTLPTMAVELARITVPNTGGGAASVDLTHRTYSTAIGGELIVPTSSMLPASAATLQKARALDTGLNYEWNGSTWSPAWTPYTPTWSSSAVAPVRNNGTLVAAYRQNLKSVEFYINLTMGSTTTYGSGTWRFTLPVTPKSGIRWMFGGGARDESAAGDYGVRAWWQSSASALILGTPATTAGDSDRGVAATSPFAWANTDVLHINGTYEAA